MAMLPISTSVCTEPGRSTRKILRPLAGLVAVGSAALVEPAFHAGIAENICVTCAGVISPEIPRMAFSGRYRVACHSASMAGVILSMACDVAEVMAAG